MTNTEPERGPGWMPLADDCSEGPRPWPAPVVSEDDGTWPMSHAQGPCRTWPVQPGCGCLPPDSSSWTSGHIAAVESATEILWRLTAGRFGLCRETIRPCRRDCLPDACQGMPVPALVGGRWLNMSCHHERPCGCGPASEIKLPGPVYWEPPSKHQPMGGRLEEPDEFRCSMQVYVDGKELTSPDGAYWLLDENRLIRTDGGHWPACQDLSKPLTEPGTWGVVYWRGIPVPPAGRRAVALLACELWKACVGAEDCKLPARVQQVQREGVTMSMVDSQEFLSQGRTGITEVDLWIASVNPHHHRQPAAVYSPDGPSVRSEWTTGEHPPAPPSRFGRWR